VPPSVVCRALSPLSLFLAPSLLSPPSSSSLCPTLDSPTFFLPQAGRSSATFDTPQQLDAPSLFSLSSSPLRLPPLPGAPYPIPSFGPLSRVRHVALRLDSARSQVGRPPLAPRPLGLNRRQRLVRLNWQPRPRRRRWARRPQAHGRQAPPSRRVACDLGPGPGCVDAGRDPDGRSYCAYLS